LEKKDINMAGPLLDLTIFTKSTPHALRAISLATFPPAFLILLIVGVCSNRVNLAIGILPLFLSSTYSAYSSPTKRNADVNQAV
jgi:hypothetical protein